LKTAFQGLENQLKIILFFFGIVVACLISPTSLPIKGDVFTVEEAQERKEKTQELHLQIKRRNYRRV